MQLRSNTPHRAEQLPGARQKGALARRMLLSWGRARGRPVYQGKQQMPRDVNWGERTTDEMCLGVLLWGQP